MTPEEFVKLLNLIQKEHKLIFESKYKGRKIKYVQAYYDTRDGTIYGVSLRSWFVKDPTFFRDSDTPKGITLFDHIVSWLNEVSEGE